MAGQGLEDDANQGQCVLGAVGGQVAVDEVVPVGELRAYRRGLTKNGVESFGPMGPVFLQQLNHNAMCGLGMNESYETVDAAAGGLVD